MSTDQPEMTSTITKTTSSDNTMADSAQSRLVGKRKRMTKQERKELKRQQQRRRRQQQQQQQQKQQKIENLVTTTVGSVDPNVNLNSESCDEKKKKKKRSNRTNSRNKHMDKVFIEHTAHSPSERSVSRFEVEDETCIQKRCMESYVPIDLPTKPSKHLLSRDGGGTSTSKQQQAAISTVEEGGGRSLGKWFPNAILVKCRIHYTNTGQLLLANNTDDNRGEIINGFHHQDDDHGIVPLPSSNEKQHNNVSIKPKASLALFYQYTDSISNRGTGVESGHWTKPQLQLLMTYLQIIAVKRNVGGRIRVAPEGVNATISAVDTLHYTAQATLRHVAEDLRRFDSVFNHTDFKFIDHLKADRHFKDLKILPVQELVFYDIQSSEAPLAMNCDDDKKTIDDDDDDNDDGNGDTARRDNTGKKKDELTKVKSASSGVHHLDAKQYHEMLQMDNTVVIDVRNHYETILGRFDGQMKQQRNQNNNNNKKKDDDDRKNECGEPGRSTTAPSSSSILSEDGQVPSGLEKLSNDTVMEECNRSTTVDSGVGCAGAEYIDPKMRKSTDFKEWLSKEETKQKIKGKTVMMFCTGGIRCERASVYLKGQMGDDVGQVYQLQGGIERYLKAFPDGGLWRGKNFVFDKRESVSVDCPDGDGGVVQKKSAPFASHTGKSESDGNSGSHVAKCCVCSIKWDRYLGKKFCLTCGVPLLICDGCLSKKIDKIPGNEFKMRCPLCVEEGVTVLASQTELTNNGINRKWRDDPSSFVNKSKADHKRVSGIHTSTSHDLDTNKAAGSILKWGGGHAQKKKQRKKMKRTLCRFGVDCARKDCFFYHPERSPSNP